jgi:hypothetical protein
MQQQPGAIGAAVLRSQLFIDACGAGNIARPLELLCAVDRGRQLRALAEARTAAEECSCGHNDREAKDGTEIHRLKSLSLAGRMPDGRNPKRREARL